MTFPAESQVSDLSQLEQKSVSLALIYSSKVELWVKDTHEKVYYTELLHPSEWRR